MIKKLFFAIVLFSFSPNVYSQTLIGKQKDLQIILKNIENFSKFYVEGNTQKIVDSYTKDGKIFPGRRDIMEGTDALTSYWTFAEGSKNISHKLTPVEIKVVKKTAYDYGYYEGESQRPDGTTSSFYGKYLIVWKKVGKEWKIHLDIWNSISRE